jgi:predicted PurR-regulated permease PerM
LHNLPSRDGEKAVRQIVIQWPSREWFRKWFLRVAVGIILIYVAYIVRDIWVPLLLAFLIATVLDPIVDRLEMRGWSRAAAASLIYGGFLAVLIAAIVAAYTPLMDQAQLIQAKFAEIFPDTTPKGLHIAFGKMHVSNSLSDFLVKIYQGTLGSFQSSNRMATYGMAAATNVIWLVVIPIISFYALRDYHTILAKGLLLVPKEKRDIVQTAVSETTGVFGKYLRGMAIVSLLNGFATWILLFAFHIPQALLVAILATFLYNVPYLGAIAINVLIAIVSFLFGGLHEMYVVTGIGLVMHNILFDQIISPRILGGHVGLHPILSIVALLVGNLLLGVVGMILAVPVAACIQIAVLALIPKLSHEIEMPKDAPPTEVDPDTVASLEVETLEAHAKVDASEELHRSVTTAVDNIEEQILIDKEEALSEEQKKEEAQAKADDGDAP